MKPRGTWHDAYDAQMALWRWSRTPRGIEFLTVGYRESIKGYPPERLNDGMKLSAAMYGAETPKLLTADPIFVSAEMCDLVEAAVEGFQPEALYSTDLLTRNGFVWYERPFAIRDRFDEPLSLHGWSYCEAQGVNDDGSPSEMGILVTIYAEVRGGPAGVCPIHLTPWYFGMTFDGNEYDLKGDPTGAGWWWRIAQVTLRLMQQKIAVQHRHRPDRATRREGQRHGFDAPGYEREIMVVRLRREREESHDPPEGEANYSHRFIVGGHWRNQWYPSGQIHRQIWIGDYVKGPEDKPLVVKPRRAFTWDR